MFDAFQINVQFISANRSSGFNWPLGNVMWRRISKVTCISAMHDARFILARDFFFISTRVTVYILQNRSTVRFSNLLELHWTAKMNQRKSDFSNWTEIFRREWDIRNNQPFSSNVLVTVETMPQVSFFLFFFSSTTDVNLFANYRKFVIREISLYLSFYVAWQKEPEKPKACANSNVEEVYECISATQRAFPFTEKFKQPFQFRNTLCIQKKKSYTFYFIYRIVVTPCSFRWRLLIRERVRIV